MAPGTCQPQAVPTLVLVGPCPVLSYTLEKVSVGADPVDLVLNRRLSQHRH